ncbi:MAG: FtsX-like permease family protein [Deltaproteobacteria bacterium]|nr:FtsX-like permease family protein [Deltaproteobacteria bacterium]
MGGNLRGWRQVCRLGLADYWHEKLLSLCAVLGLAAVLTPLLLLLGIKYGVIAALTQRLLADPRNLEVVAVGSGRYDAAWFARLAAQPVTAFLLPQTRAIAATMHLVSPGAASPVLVDLTPSAPGDPLLARWDLAAPGPREVVLSWPAARRAGARAGDRLVGRVGRVQGGQRQEGRVQLKVVGVLPLEAQAREAAYVPLPLLEATEDFRDGFAVPALGWPGEARPAAPRVFPSFRLYARDLDAVGELRDQLLAQDMEVHTRAEEIAAVKSLEQAFSLIFGLLVAVAGLGWFAAALASNLANVRRKMRHLGVARLLGFLTRHLVWFPMVQAGITSLLGALVALGLYEVVAVVINQQFSPRVCPGEAVCRLLPRHAVAVLGLTVLVSLLAAAAAAWRVARLEPAEVLREV